MPALCSTPSRQRREHHSAGSPRRVQRTASRRLPQRSQVSVTQMPCSRNSRALCVSLSLIGHTSALERSSQAAIFIWNGSSRLWVRFCPPGTIPANMTEQVPVPRSYVGPPIGRHHLLFDVFRESCNASVPICPY